MRIQSNQPPVNPQPPAQPPQGQTPPQPPADPQETFQPSPPEPEKFNALRTTSTLANTVGLGTVLAGMAWKNTPLFVVGACFATVGVGCWIANKFHH